MNIYEALHRYFGLTSFRPGQEEIIQKILDGENVIAILPTGAGKSICYQIPALISENFSIVVSPLIALMKDQVDTLNKKVDFAAFVNSSMSFAEAEKVLQLISQGNIKLLYVSPERLEVLPFAEKIKKLRPSYLFVDEAHCISEWGHSFRPGYTKIKDFIAFTGIKKVSAFTATATPEVTADIAKQLGLTKHDVVVRGFARENLHLNVMITKNKKSDTLHLLRNNPATAIIYTSSRKQAEEISGFLNLSKVECEFYHAGLNPVIRRKIQDDFVNGQLRVIAATNAFGMGIDKSDIRMVIHYNIPGSLESYYQEIGRAGRDGKDAAAYLLYDEKDIDIQNYFIENSYPDKKFIQNLYQAICDYGQIAEGNMPDKEIAVNSDFLTAVMQREVPRGMLHSAIRILEAGGYMKLLSEFDKNSTIQVLLEINKLRNLIKGSFNPLLKDVLIILVREYGSRIFSRKIQIDIEDTASKISLPPDDMIRSLEDLNNMGIIAYRQISGKDNVMLMQPRTDPSRLKLDYKKLNENYIRAQNKLQQMVNFVFNDECRSKYILNYFGENADGYKCGKCDRCLTVNITSGMTKEYLKELLLRTLFTSKDLLNEITIIRILTGKEKSLLLQGLETFGAASNIGRDELKNALGELLAERKIERNKINAKYLQLSHKGIDFLKSNKLVEIPDIADYSTDLELFNLLREIRSKAAKKFVQPAYIICPDEVLRDIARIKPKDRSALIKIDGFNERMFTKVGHSFLETITEFLKEPGTPALQKADQKISLPKNIKETYSLLNKKYSLKDIAALLRLSDAVVSMQIETILEYYPETDISSLSSTEEMQRINEQINKGITDIKILKGVLPQEIPWSLVRIVLAKFKASKRKNSSSAFQYEL